MRKTGSRRVGEAGPDTDGRQTERQPIEKTATGIVLQQQLADGLLGAIAGQRCGEKTIVNLIGHRRTEDSNRRREDETRAITVRLGKLAYRVEQVTGSLQVDPIALVEVLFGLARHHGRQMDDHIRTTADKLLCRAWV